MKCPICTVSLIVVRPGAMRCPSGHGLLVSVKVLKGVGTSLTWAHLRQADAIDASAATSTSKTRIIGCPVCQSPMMVIDYAGSGIMIDACFSCSQRWLDAGELTKINALARHGRGLKPDQLLALEGLNSALTQVAADQKHHTRG